MEEASDRTGGGLGCCVQAEGRETALAGSGCVRSQLLAGLVCTLYAACWLLSRVQLMDPGL